MNYSKKCRALLVLLSLFVFAFPLSAQTDSSQNSSSSNFEDFENPNENTSNPEAGYLIGGVSEENGGNVSAGSGFWPVFRMFLVLAVIIFVLWLLFKFLKKSTAPGAEDDPFLRKISHITLSPGKTVQIVTLLDHAYLLGVSDDSVNLIEKIDDKELINAFNVYADKTNETSKPKNFSELLEIFLPKKNGDSAQKNTKKKSFGKKGSVFDSSVTSMIDSLKNKRLKNGDDL